jgi:hypothetical protein
MVTELNDLAQNSVEVNPWLSSVTGDIRNFSRGRIRLNFVSTRTNHSTLAGVVFSSRPASPGLFKQEKMKWSRRRGQVI